MDTGQLINSLGHITPGHLWFLAGGFLLGVLVSLVLARSGLFFFSRRLKALSEQALFHNSNKFLEMAQTYFSGYVREARQDFRAKGDEIRLAVDPVHKVLEKYERQLGAMEKDRERAYGDISRYLGEMSLTQAKLFRETGNLVKALRVPHVRGRWGETTLRRAVELAGMADHCDFEEQVTAGAGNNLRPDMVVTLPGNRKIVIDAKVPLMAYLDALEAEDEAEVEARMADHARQVGAHIRMLGAKQYTAAFSPALNLWSCLFRGRIFSQLPFLGSRTFWKKESKRVWFWPLPPPSSPCSRPLPTPGSSKRGLKMPRPSGTWGRSFTLGFRAWPAT